MQDGVQDRLQNGQDIQGRLFWPESTLFRGPPLYRPSTPWGAASALAVGLLIIVLSGLIAGGILILFGWAEQVPAGMPGRDMSNVEAGIGMRMLGIWQVIVVLLTVLAALRGGARNVLALHPLRRPVITLATAIAVLAVFQVVLGLVQHYVMRHDLMTDLRLFYGLIRGPDWIIPAAIIGIGAPLSEELLFRGFLQSALARTRIGFWWAALITTLLWTTLHAGYSLMGLIEVFLIGIFFSWLLWRTGSLWTSIFCHAFYNSLIVLILRFADLPM